MTTNTEVSTTLIPHAKLVPSKKVNARKHGGSEGIDELAALIRHKGLLQPLVVRPAKKGDKFEITAGDRRHRAIGVLIKLGDWPKERDAARRLGGDIPCIVREESDEEARETSAVENIGRLQMHPVDEFEHFAELAAQGDSDADIAANYGITEKRVRQRRALGAIIPEVRAAWREGRINADTAQAFTLTDKPDAQLQVFEKLSKNGSLADWAVRRELAAGRIKTDDERFQLVGREAYEAAGGRLVEDLFNEHSYIEDPHLLDGLMNAHLQAACDRLVASGWGWAELHDNLPKDWQGWSRLREPSEMDLTTAEAARIDEIEARVKELEKLEDEDGLDPAQESEKERLEREQQEIENWGLDRSYAAKDKKRAGCVVAVGHDNGLEIIFGVKRPKEAKAGDTVDLEDAIDATPVPSAKAETKGPFEISAALVQSVTRDRTEAAAKVIEANPVIALQLLVATLGSYTPKPVDISINRNMAGGRTVDYKDFDKRLKAVLALDSDALSRELAQLVAAGVNLVSWNPGSAIDADRGLIALLPGEAYLEAAREAFNGADYFSRSGKATGEAALAEMVKAGTIEKGDLPGPGAKKADVAEVAADKAKATGWLPPELRHPDYAIGTTKPKAKRGARKEAA